MKDNRYHAEYLIPNEIVDRYPTEMQRVIKHLGEQLTEKLFCEIQKGEMIVCLKDVTTNDNYPLNMTEVRQEIRITDLVRCKDCIYFHDYGDGVKNCWGNGGGTKDDDFCSHAERKDG